MELNERELMKVRDILGDLDNISDYIIYKDKKKAKENKKILKKMIHVIDHESIEDAVDELCE